MDVAAMTLDELNASCAEAHGQAQVILNGFRGFQHAEAVLEMSTLMLGKLAGLAQEEAKAQARLAQAQEAWASECEAIEALREEAQAQLAQVQQLLVTRQAELSELHGRYDALAQAVTDRQNTECEAALYTAVIAERQQQLDQLRQEITAFEAECETRRQVAQRAVDQVEAQRQKLVERLVAS